MGSSCDVTSQWFLPPLSSVFAGTALAVVFVGLRCPCATPRVPPLSHRRRFPRPPPLLRRRCFRRERVCYCRARHVGRQPRKNLSRLRRGHRLRLRRTSANATTGADGDPWSLLDDSGAVLSSSSSSGRRTANSPTARVTILSSAMGRVRPLATQHTHHNSTRRVRTFGITPSVSTSPTRSSRCRLLTNTLADEHSGRAPTATLWNGST